jgi:hypothetical protein
MTSTRVLRKPGLDDVAAGADPPTKAGLAKALEDARQLKSRFAVGTLDFELAAAIEEAIEEEFALCELSEDFAKVVLKEAEKVAAIGGPEAVKEFFATGERVVKAFLPSR